MDNAAFLRIKFTPLLKKVSSENIVSKCCIEIVPELSGTQNLEKIDWKIDNDLVEYNIPMTYKVIIKNPIPLNNDFPNKVYHSCVDLLSAYSTSNMNLASGDVKSVKSDNLLVLNSNSCEDKYEVISTKALLTNNERNRIKNKTTSIHALKIDGTSSHHNLGVDQCLEANFNNNLADVRVSKSEETLRAETDKYDNATNTLDDFDESDNNLAKKISTESLSAYIESFNEKFTQRKLSLSPICSVNTWDTFPPGPIYLTKKNTSSYTFCKTKPKNKVKRTDKGFNSPRKNDSKKENNNNMLYSESGHKLRLYKAKTNVTIQIIDDIDDSDYENEIKTEGKEALTHRYSSFKDITTSISRITMTGYGIEKSQNNIKIKNVIKSIDLSKCRKHTNHINLEPLNTMFRKEKYSIMTNDDKNIMPASKIDPLKKQCLIRATPAIRVARFVKRIEEEIYPLKQMLFEIRSKCVSLGLDLFRNEFVAPSQKSIIYEPIPNFEYLVNETGSQQKSTEKSNRVVYTILYNG